MIRTHDRSGERTSLLLTHARAAVAAHVEMGAHHAVAAADDDKALAEHLAQKIVARIGDLLGAPDAQPTLREDAFCFKSEYLGRRVVALRHCRRPGADGGFLINGHGGAPYEDRVTLVAFTSSLGELSLAPNVYA